MSSKVFALFAIVFLAYVQMGCSSPARPEVAEAPDNGNFVEIEPEAVAVEEFFKPQPRVTCDLVGDERLCAAHCISLGYRGGYCSAQKVCVCRR